MNWVKTLFCALVASLAGCLIYMGLAIATDIQPTWFGLPVSVMAGRLVYLSAGRSGGRKLQFAAVCSAYFAHSFSLMLDEFTFPAQHSFGHLLGVAVFAPILVPDRIIEADVLLICGFILAWFAAGNWARQQPRIAD